MKQKQTDPSTGRRRTTTNFYIIHKFQLSRSMQIGNISEHTCLELGSQTGKNISINSQEEETTETWGIITGKTITCFKVLKEQADYRGKKGYTNNCKNKHKFWHHYQSVHVYWGQYRIFHR